MSNEQYNRNFPQIGEKPAASAQGAAGTKRKRTNSEQVVLRKEKMPRPAGGVTFTTGEKPKQRPPPRNDAAMDETADEGPATLEAQKALEAKREEERLLKAFLDSNDDDQAPYEGTIRLIKTSTPRYASWRLWKKELVHDPPLAIEFQRRKEAGKPWLWVQVYGNPGPTQKDVDRFHRAIAHASKSGVAEGLEPDAFKPRVIRKQGGKTAPTLLVFAEDEKQAKLLLGLGNFEYHETAGASIYLLQGGESPANAIILDVKNAPQDPALLMKGCLRALYDAIRWKEKDGDKLVPYHFAYAKVEGLKTQAGEKGTTWRVAFEPDHATISKWKFQKSAGIHSDRGEVTLERPPFCNMCISHSHQPATCNWWKLDNARSEAKKPANYVKLKWTNQKAFNVSDLPKGVLDVEAKEASGGELSQGKTAAVETAV